MWVLSLGAALAYGATALIGMAGCRAGAAPWWALGAAWLLHALALGCGLLGQQFGFAPALSMTAWLVLTAYGLERQVFPQMRARLALAALGMVAVVLAALFPGAPLHVSASPWLAPHLALGLASYGLFGVSVVHAALTARAEQHMRQGADDGSGLPLLTLERLTFRFVAAGFVLLTATLVVGWLFGEQIYGRAWVWNHKTVFSLLSWLTFAVLLFGRARFGWRGRSAVRVLYTGAALLLLAYVGSRFVLEVLLGGRAP